MNKLLAILLVLFIVILFWVVFYENSNVPNSSSAHHKAKTAHHKALVAAPHATVQNFSPAVSPSNSSSGSAAPHINPYIQNTVSEYENMVNEIDWDNMSRGLNVDFKEHSYDQTLRMLREMEIAQTEDINVFS